MKERPILFSSPMVQAILEGRKAQTRRILKQKLPIGVKWWEVYDGELNYRIVDEKAIYTHCKCPYGKVGDLLWVRESFVKDYFDDGQPAYKADWSNTSKEYVPKPKWKPSIHMSKEFCRIELRIKNIRVERLQSISQDDAIREGVKGIYQCRTLIESFKSLWSEINGQKSWNENPFVWVIEFEVARSPKHHPDTKCGERNIN